MLLTELLFRGRLFTIAPLYAERRNGMKEIDLILINSMLYKLDDKSRIVLPSPYRKILFDDIAENATVYLVINPAQKIIDRCLLMLTEEEFVEYYKKLSAIPTKSSAYKLVRHVFANVAKVRADKNWKLQLPANLRTYAGITGEVEIVYSGKYIELWSPERMSAKLDTDCSDMQALQQLADAMDGDTNTVDEVAASRKAKQDEIEGIELERQRLSAMLEVKKLKRQLNEDE